MKHVDNTALEAVMKALSQQQAADAWFLAHGLDEKLEASQKDGSGIESTIESVLPWITEHMGAQSTGVRVNLRHREDYYASAGTAPELVDEMLRAGEAVYNEDGDACSVTLDVNGEEIGLIAASFPKGTLSENALIGLKVVAEELDTLFFELIRISNHRWQTQQLQSIMAAPVLEKSVGNATILLKMEAGLESLLIIYSEMSMTSSLKKGHVFVPGKGGVSLDAQDVVTLWDIISSDTPDYGEVARIAGLSGEHFLSVPVVTGLSSRGKEGVVVAAGGEKLSLTSGEELLDMFSSILGQRLVDYHKEQRYLQQYFCPDIVVRLLADDNYLVNHLYPRLHEIAMVYSDVTSFTKISEQVLDDPAEVCDFIDYWSEGVFKIIFEHGGAIDKMVGDCIIGLFGPPFYEMSPVECCMNAVKCGLAINEYTAALTGHPVIDKIKSSTLIPGLGVATGINYGSVMVGTVSPNMDYTAFGKDMNNCARLQGVAGYREVLVMSNMRDILESDDTADETYFDWGPQGSEAVKNVEEPLQFFRVKRK